MKKINHLFTDMEAFNTFLLSQSQYMGSKDLIVDLMSYGDFSDIVDEVKEKIQTFNPYARILHSSMKASSKQLRVVCYCDTGVEKRVKKECQESKLVQMKEMINMIAHHWRQPLNTISSLAMSLELSSKFGSLNDEEVQKHCHTIQKNANNLSQVITIFSHFGQYEKSDEEFFLLKVVDETLILFQTHLESFHIECALNIDPQLKAQGDSKLFKQVLFNIISNAVDAFEQIDTNEKLLSVDIVIAGDEIILKIQDNAGGVSQDFQNKIFNPYFTTKIDCECSGLGLTISQEIIKSQFNGDLDFHALADGSEFIIKIPNQNNFKQRYNK